MERTKVVRTRNDLEIVHGVMSAALRREVNGEFVFPFEHALEVIQACTSAGIAVLGVEVCPGLNVSTYDLHMKDPDNENFWLSYVRTNNALAEDFVRRNPAPSSSECVLTTFSWREFREIKASFKS